MWKRKEEGEFEALENRRSLSARCANLAVNFVVGHIVVSPLSTLPHHPRFSSLRISAIVSANRNWTSPPGNESIHGSRLFSEPGERLVLLLSVQSKGSMRLWQDLVGFWVQGLVPLRWGTLIVTIANVYCTPNPWFFLQV